MFKNLLGRATGLLGLTPKKPTPQPQPQQKIPITAVEKALVQVMYPGISSAGADYIINRMKKKPRHAKKK